MTTIDPKILARLTPEQRKILQERLPKYRIQMMKLETGAASPHESASHTDSIVMAALIRDELWAKDDLFDRAMLAEHLVTRIRLHGVAEELDNMTKVVNSCVENKEIPNEIAAMIMAFIIAASEHGKDRYGKLLGEMTPFVERLRNRLAAEAKKCPPATPSEG